MRQLVNYLFIILFSAIWFGCNDNDDIYWGVDNLSKDESLFLEMKSLLFRTVSDETGNEYYVPNLGEVIDVATPTVYAVGVNSIEEARYDFFEYCIPYSMRDSLSNINEDVVIDFGEFGKIHYVENNNSLSYASLSIDLNSISNVTRIDFIPLDLWPNNNTALTPFHLGDIVKDECFDVYYICVRECDNGNDGLLVSFDEKLSNTHLFKVKDYVSANSTEYVLPLASYYGAYNLTLHAFPERAQWITIASCVVLQPYKDWVTDIKDYAQNDNLNPEIKERISWLWNSDAGKALIGECSADYIFHPYGVGDAVYVCYVHLDTTELKESTHEDKTKYYSFPDGTLEVGGVTGKKKNKEYWNHWDNDWKEGKKYRDNYRTNAYAIYFSKSKFPHLERRFSLIYDYSLIDNNS